MNHEQFINKLQNEKRKDEQLRKSGGKNVHYGTPLFDGEDENKDGMKSSKVNKYAAEWNQYAVNERGKRVFTGAFTGGFTAGYGNTCGSKQGWTPKAFVSSRDSRNALQQTVLDFMDDEDLKQSVTNPIQMKDDFKQQDSVQSREVDTLNDDRHLNALFGGVGDTDSNVTNSVPAYLPSSLIRSKPAISQIGFKLLTKMGWTQGLAIGEKRMKKKVMRPVYGVTLPPHLQKKKEEEEEVEEVIVYDTHNVVLKPKNNEYGIGYTQQSIQSEVSSRSDKATNQILLSAALRSEPNQIDLNEYDIDIATRAKKTQTIGPVSRNITFTLAGEPYRQHTKNYPPPAIPTDFIPIHKATESEEVPSTRVQLDVNSVTQRAKILGEQVKTEEVNRTKPLLESEHTKELRNKLSSAMAQRFTKGRTQEMQLEQLDRSKYGLLQVFADEEADEQPAVTIPEKQSKPKSSRLPRETLSWYPESLLCKRLGVINNFASQPRKGTQKLTAKKSNTIFDDSLFSGFITASNSAQESSNLETDAPVHEEKLVTTNRPAMDIFKAIFEDPEEENEQKPPISSVPQSSPNNSPTTDLQVIIVPDDQPVPRTMSIQEQRDRLLREVALEMNLGTTAEDLMDESDDDMFLSQIKANAVLLQPPVTHSAPAIQPDLPSVPISSSTTEPKPSSDNREVNKITALEAEINALERLLGKHAHDTSSESEGKRKKRKRKKKSRDSDSEEERRRRKKRKKEKRRREKERKKSHKYSSESEDESSVRSKKKSRYSH